MTNRWGENPSKKKMEQACQWISADQEEDGSTDLAVQFILVVCRESHGHPCRIVAQQPHGLGEPHVVRQEIFAPSDRGGFPPATIRVVGGKAAFG